MNILETEIVRNEVIDLISLIEGDTPIEKFISIIPTVRRLSFLSEERKLMLALGTIITYYGMKSEIGMKIYSEIDAVMRMEEMFLARASDTEIYNEAERICPEPIGLIKLWVKYYLKEKELI